MVSEFSLPKTFDPHLNPSQIVLIGVGGTGAHLSRFLARLLSHMHSLRLNTPRLILIDPDIVETKNVGRQLFSPADVGYSKAEVIAKRLSLAFGLEIEWLSESFDAQKHLGRDGYGTILIDAVDNHLARQEIAKASQGYSRLLISCGNHRDAGQVCIGNCGKSADLERYLADIAKRQDKLGNKDALQYLPSAYLLFPELLEAEAPATIPIPEASCADLLLQQEQDLFINDAVALVAARYVQQILLRQPIQSFLSFVSLSSMTTIKPVPITLENLQSYLKLASPN
jgi:PRTRC genetic system ThiF family protein